MENLEKLVIGLGVMSDTGLRGAKNVVGESSAPTQVKELIVSLIDFYLSIGEDPRKRGEAAAVCLAAIGRIQRGGSSSRSSSTYSSSSRGSSGGSAGKVIVALLLVVGVGVAIWLAAR